MRKGMQKPVLAILLSVLVSLHAAEPLPVLADTTDETGGTTAGEDTGQETEEEEGRTIETTSFYQDDNGMIYRWYGYDDGTAEIYEFEPATEEIVIDIPEELDGYVVTSLTGSVTYKTIESLTIPETITHFGKSTFYNDVINNLYYNAVDAGNEGDFFYCPFAYSDVYNLYIGDAVEVIEGYTFYQTVFHQEEIALHVPHIGTYAFHSAVFEVLTLTNDIGQIDEMAFTQAKMEYLCYNCPDVAFSDVDDAVSSPFYMAVIKGLEFSDHITAVPDYLFANAHFKMKEFTIDRERIGKKAFYQVWNTTDFYAGTDMVETLTITEDVKFIGEEAFAQCWIKELLWNADVETDASSTVTGIFYMADIFGITIGENVEKLPDYCFANADLNFTEFTISTPQIGTACFYDAWVSNNLDDYPVNLTITDEVTYIGARAFERSIISYLDYESNAVTGATSTVTGPFYMAELSGLTIGEQVEEIQPFLFANTDFMENMDLTIDVPIGNYAFYTALSYYKGFENLTIGEHVTSMGKGAFYNRDISSLTYNAVYAENANTKTGEAAFWSCEIGSLAIGEQVEVLDAGTFCGIQLSQEELVIPDSVREIGNYVLYNASYIADQIDIDTLKIGSGLQYISYNAFRELSFSSIYVEALEVREDYNPVISSAYTKYLPGCDNLYIHHDSAFYSFFEVNAANVNLYCDDYMVPSEGEEYFDEDTHQYVTPSYETCSVCGYQITTNAYEAACAVGMNSVQETIIDECVHALFAPFMVNGRLRKISDDEMPTLTDLRMELSRRREPEARELVYALKLYTGDGSLSIFGHHTNVEITNRLVVFQIRDVGERLKNLAMLVILEHIWNDIVKNRKLGKTTWYYIKFAVEGHLSTGGYEKDGVHISTVEIIVENIQFCERKERPGNGQSGEPFLDIPEEMMAEMPFK